MLSKERRSSNRNEERKKRDQETPKYLAAQQSRLGGNDVGSRVVKVLVTESVVDKGKENQMRVRLGECTARLGKFQLCGVCTTQLMDS
jgi:hypothetical protein